MKERKTNIVIFTIIVASIMLSCIAFILFSTKQTNNIDKTQLLQGDPLVDYDFSHLKGDEILSYEDDKYISKFGIDVSEFSEEIDFNKLKEEGVEFIYMRLGYRSKIDGSLNLDAKFEEYYKQAVDNGFLVGVYFFSQALNPEEAKQEANFVLSKIYNKKISLPIAYDLELPDDSRIKKVNAFIKTENAISFLDTIKNNNYRVIVYTSENFANLNYILNELSIYDFWLAQYGTNNPTFNYPYSIWQYAQNKKLDGIDGDVDFNIMFMRKDDQY